MSESKNPLTERTFIVECESPACSKVTAYQPGGGRMPYKRCAQCKIANYCSRECQVAHWPQHRASCEKYGADRAITESWQRFGSNFTRMVDLKVFKRIMSDTMKQRGFVTRRGALALEFKTLKEMDDAVEKLSQPYEFCKLSMAFFDVETFRKSGARPEVIRDMETYPLDRKFFVYMQMPAGGGSRENLMNFVSLPYVKDE